MEFAYLRDLPQESLLFQGKIFLVIDGIQHLTAEQRLRLKMGVGFMFQIVKSIKRWGVLVHFALILKER